MSTDEFTGFKTDTLKFLDDLAANNNRDWFQDNKTRYEKEFLEPAVLFIQAMAPRLENISGHFVASAKKTGGSLMRIYRDTRFSKEKIPYKTNIGIQFRHERGKDVHAPGYYVHIASDGIFIGVGIWRPESAYLAKIREAISETPKQWLTIRDAPEFKRYFELSGESLQRPPKGYAKDHPMIEDLKRKDFIAIRNLDNEAAANPGFVDEVEKSFVVAKPYMGFLCQALELRF
jgi:uncharacterized protein (TIGR02453 family)